MKERRKGQAPDFFSRQVSTARRFYLDLRRGRRESLAVVGGGWERCAPDYRIARTTFPYYGIEYVVGGAGRLVMQGRAYELNRGCAYAYGPGVRHEITTATGDRLAKYFVDFTGARSPRLMRECGLGPGVVRLVGQEDSVERAFEELVRAGLSTGEQAARLSALQLEILLVTISEQGVPAESSDRRSHATFVRCRRHIERNFLAHASIGEAAVACHVDAAYLCRLFARYSAQTPYRFLQRLRMNHAAAMLEDRRCMVREAADALGMDPFAFSRVFKRVHGLAPRVFLRRRAAEARDTEQD